MKLIIRPLKTLLTPVKTIHVPVTITTLSEETKDVLLPVVSEEYGHVKYPVHVATLATTSRFSTTALNYKVEHLTQTKYDTEFVGYDDYDLEVKSELGKLIVALSSEFSQLISFSYDEPKTFCVVAVPDLHARMRPNKEKSKVIAYFDCPKLLDMMLSHIPDRELRTLDEVIKQAYEGKISFDHKHFMYKSLVAKKIIPAIVDAHLLDNGGEHF